MRLYSQSTGNCYIPSVHSVIPDDAFELPDEVFLSVIANPTPGKVRSHDKNGLPILIDPPPTSDAELAAIERQWRDGKVGETEWLVARHRDELDMQQATTLTAEQFTALLTYRQELRDWPLAPDFPNASGRPVEPEWLASQGQ